MDDELREHRIYSDLHSFFIDDEDVLSYRCLSPLIGELAWKKVGFPGGAKGAIEDVENLSTEDKLRILFKIFQVEIAKEHFLEKREFLKSLGGIESICVTENDIVDIFLNQHKKYNKKLLLDPDHIKDMVHYVDKSMRIQSISKNWIDRIE